jgi:hypothetical protein
MWTNNELIHHLQQRRWYPSVTSRRFLGLPWCQPVVGELLVERTLDLDLAAAGKI